MGFPARIMGPAGDAGLNKPYCLRHAVVVTVYRDRAPRKWIRSRSERNEKTMAIKEVSRPRVPRGTKSVTQAFFEALDGIPDSQQAAVISAALAGIRDEVKARHLKRRENAAKAKAKAVAKKAAAKKAAAKKAAPAVRGTKATPATRRSPAAAKKAPARKAPAAKVPARKAPSANRELAKRTVASPAGKAKRARKLPVQPPESGTE
jgi:hypothetical protein